MGNNIKSYCWCYEIHHVSSIDSMAQSSSNPNVSAWNPHGHDEHPDASQVMGLDGYTSEVGTTWNIFTVVFCVTKTFFKLKKVACHNDLELETSMKYGCFFWMITSLYKAFKKTSFRFQEGNQKDFQPEILLFFSKHCLLVRILCYVETIPVSFIEVLCHKIHEVSRLGLQRNRPSSAKKVDMEKKKKGSHHQKPSRISWFGFSCCFFSQKKKTLWQWPASIVNKSPRMASEKVALQR